MIASAAKARGKKLGRQTGQRPSDPKADKVIQLSEGVLNYRLIGRQVGLSKNTVGDIVKRNLDAKAGFSSQVRRTVIGVFHHISPEHADLYFGEIGFRWSQRVVGRNVQRQSRSGRTSVRIYWMAMQPAVKCPGRM